jgi:hypothetical protein
VGGTGYVRARGLPALAEVEVELHEYATGRSSAVRPWKAPARVPAGEYRAVVRSLPVYVQERFTVAAAETSSLLVTGIGTLQVDVAPGAVLGTFLSGVRQAVLAGTYDLLVETVPSHVEPGVRVQAGAACVVSLSAARAASLARAPGSSSAARGRIPPPRRTRLATLTSEAR